MATICLSALASAPGPKALVRPTRELGRAVLERSLLGWLRVGLAEPSRSPGSLVSSYLTVSPLPLARRSVLCGAFHGSPRLGVTSTLPCGVRTFLERCRPRPPGRLLRAQSRNATGRIIRTMRARVALAIVPVLAFVLALTACAQQPVGPAAPIAPATRAGSRARGLVRAAGGRRVRRGVPGIARSGDRRLRQLVVGPDLRSWVRWLDVQHREFDGTIESAADVRDVEFIGAVTARRIPLASVGLSASVLFSSIRPTTTRSISSESWTAPSP